MADPRRVFELTARLLKAQIELLFLEVNQLILELVIGLYANIVGHR
jgi:hypothetical protein